MPKFIIKEVSTVVTTYEVEAKNEEQAEDELYNGVSKEVKEERSDVYIDSITLKEGGNILCVECKKGFSGIEGKEDTCPSCLEKLMKNITPTWAKKRLEYLRGEIQAERISYGEIAELQSLAPFIEAGDVELLEWAGVPEFQEA